MQSWYSYRERSSRKLIRISGASSPSPVISRSPPIKWFAIARADGLSFQLYVQVIFNAFIIAACAGSLLFSIRFGIKGLFPSTNLLACFNLPALFVGPYSSQSVSCIEGCPCSIHHSYLVSMECIFHNQAYIATLPKIASIGALWVWVW